MRRGLLILALMLTALTASCVPRDCTGFKIPPKPGDPAAAEPAQQSQDVP